MRERKDYKLKEKIIMNNYEPNEIKKLSLTSQAFKLFVEKNTY